MIIEASNHFEALMNVILTIMGVAMMLAFIRLVLGPSLCDRVVALDLMMTLATGVIAIYAIFARQPVFLFAVIIATLIAFLGTLGFVYYIEKRDSS